MRSCATSREAFIAAMMDAGVEFVACDDPHATRVTLHILAAVAEHEWEMITSRTRAALQAAKVRGVRLGRNAERLAPANHAAAVDRAKQTKGKARDAEKGQVQGPPTRQGCSEIYG